MTDWQANISTTPVQTTVQTLERIGAHSHVRGYVSNSLTDAQSGTGRAS